MNIKGCEKMESMKWIWQYVRKYRLLMIGVFILIFIASGISIIYPLLGGKVIDDVVYQNKTNLLIPLLLIMIISTIIRTICRYTYQIMCERIGQNSLFEFGKTCIKSCNHSILTFSIIRALGILWRG